jgi:CheY-like chemotaxis protein
MKKEACRPGKPPLSFQPNFIPKGIKEMGAPRSTIRGLINDLTRTLTGSMVHMDDLLLRLDNDSGEFDDAWLANQQLERALEFFIELRSEYMIRQESINKKTKSYKLTAVEKLLHNFNNLLAVVVGYCDMIKDDIVDVQQIGQITDNIYKSIQTSHYSLNETICLPEHNVSLNKLHLSHGKIKQALTVPIKINQRDNRILLVEDDDGVKQFISTVLRKHNYTVVGCSKGEKALAIFEQSKANFGLCIVDVGLPDIEGPDLVKKILLQKPNINVLFISGYNETKLKVHFTAIGPRQILIKPFRLEELLNKVRSIMLQ